MKFSPIITTEDFAEIQNQENVIIIEAGSGGISRENYQEKHLRNAFYLDLNDDLAKATKDAADGGRHPLPDVVIFEKSLEKIGVSKDVHIIIYDDKNGVNASARLWWMLRSIGFEKVQVLNGGLQAAEKLGLDTTSEIPVAKNSESLNLTFWNLPTKNLEEVKTASANSENLVIDVRENARYNGETEPIDLIAGHIPNAINLPFQNNLDENGLFKSPEILKVYFSKVLHNKDSKDIIVHCGSGVTACHTILAMDYAGLPIPNLYVGSWSEWSRNNLEIAKNI